MLPKRGSDVKERLDKRIKGGKMMDKDFTISFLGA
jgi:hypothetical protein